jgi:mRNA-degrading endonuclease toxin of MazEF toxin-antitoxin module
MQEFDKWNEVKKTVQQKQKVATFKERGIYWASVGKNIGYEQNGKGGEYLRPILVFRKFSKNSFLGIPLTTNQKDDKFHFIFKFRDEKTSSASLSQIRLFDAKRLERNIGKISIEDFVKLEEKLKKIMFPLGKAKE